MPKPKFTYLLNLSEQDYYRLKRKADKEGHSFADALRLAIRAWTKHEGVTYNAKIQV